MTATVESSIASEPARPEPVPFGPGSLTWELAGQNTFLPGVGSAFLLQVMHPQIDPVLERWSTYLTDPWGRYARSAASLQTWVYGGETAIEEGHRLREVHKDFAATDAQGRGVHALNADLYSWVHQTGFYAISAYTKYFVTKPFADDQEDRLYQEHLNLGRILQIPERMLPPTIADYWAYFDDMVEGTLENTQTAQHLLAQFDDRLATPPSLPAVLRPAWGPFSRVAGGLTRFIIIGTIPPTARDKLGIKWSPADERRLRILGRAIAHGTARLPERVRYSTLAYQARQAARAQQRLQKTLAHRPM